MAWQQHSEQSSTPAPSTVLVQRAYVRVVITGRCATWQECIKLTAERVGMTEERVMEILWGRPGSGV